MFILSLLSIAKNVFIKTGVNAISSPKTTVLGIASAVGLSYFGMHDAALIGASLLAAGSDK